MARIWILLLLAVATVSACGNESNPFDENEVVDQTPGDGDDDGGDDGSPIDSDRTLPPGTSSPAPDASIFRREGQNDDGGGYVSSISYDSGLDTFTVDGLAFDGGNAYTRVELSGAGGAGSVGGYAVYEAPIEYQDADTGTPINQLLHRAIYGVSTSGQTEFAIVRSGGYVPYGFGGFVYQRNGSVTLPATGQATYSGKYAGLRVFDGTSGLEYTDGDMTIDIDFEDFNAPDGVKAEVTNRNVYDINGNDITDDILAAMDGTPTELPTLHFVVQPGVADTNGEITGSVSSFTYEDGVASEYEEGTYYAVLSDGADNDLDAEEIVGVIVMTSDDPRIDGRTVQETGGFILYR